MGIIANIKSYAKKRYEHESQKKAVYTEERNKAEIKYTKQKAVQDAKRRVLGEPKESMPARKQGSGMGSSFLTGGTSSQKMDPAVMNFYGGGSTSPTPKKKKQEQLRYGWM